MSCGLPVSWHLGFSPVSPSNRAEAWCRHNVQSFRRFHWSLRQHMIEALEAVHEAPVLERKVEHRRPESVSIRGIVIFGQAA